MYNQSPKNTVTTLADQAANAAEQGIKATKDVANEALDHLSDGVQEAREKAGDLVQRGVDTVRETSQQLQDKALRASQTTVRYIKDEPVKSILIAAATGAALMALIGLVNRNHGRS